MLPILKLIVLHSPWALRAQKVVECIRHKERPPCSCRVARFLPRHPCSLLDLAQVLTCTSMKGMQIMSEAGQPGEAMNHSQEYAAQLLG